MRSARNPAVTGSGWRRLLRFVGFNPQWSRKCAEHCLALCGGMTAMRFAWAAISRLRSLPSSPPASSIGLDRKNGHGPPPQGDIELALAPEARPKGASPFVSSAVAPAAVFLPGNTSALHGSRMGRFARLFAVVTARLACSASTPRPATMRDLRPRPFSPGRGGRPAGAGIAWLPMSSASKKLGETWLFPLPYLERPHGEPACAS